MNKKQLERMKQGLGFVAALDQSGGSTPKALKAYGIEESRYNGEEEMFDMVHAMRSRIITSPSFTDERILAAILFEMTMDRSIEGKLTADFLWEEKGIVPILKVDKGLADLKDGVQLMKPMPELDALLDRANERNIFGTKMRSVIKEANEAGIKEIVKQQFEVAAQIFAKGLVPIIEPEVDIHAPEKEKCEEILKREIMANLKTLGDDVFYMFKLTIPTKADFYSDLIADSHVLRVLALSGGYSQKEANDLLAKNKGLIASFSRASAQDLNDAQSDAEFDAALKSSIEVIYAASVA